VRAALLYDLDHPDHLIGLVTTVSRQQEPDIRRVVGWYLARWNAQENSFRALIAFGQLNTHFGLQVTPPVSDRHVAKQMADWMMHWQALTHTLERKLVQRAEQAHRLEQ
jgi:hypothetical protein